MADTLEVVILAKDEASKVFNRVGDALGTAFKVGAGVAVAGLGALTAALGLAVTEAMDAEVIQSKLNAVIQSTGGVAGVSAREANTLAESLSKVTRFSDDTIVSTETMLLTFTNIGERIFPQATEAALNMAEMFGSADQAAIQLGKALNDPIQGVTALRRVGVTLSEQQEELIRQYVESGDLLSAQQVILKELEKEFGGVARAAGNTLGGKLAILKNRLLDVAEGIGMRLLPPLLDMTNIIFDKALPVIERLGETLAPVFESAIWPVQRLFENLSAGMGLKDALVKLFDDAALALEWFLTKIGVSTDFADKFTDAFREAGKIIGDLVFDKIVPFVKEHAEGFKAALIAIGAVLGGAAIVSGVLAVGAAIAALFNPITLIIGGIALLAMAWQEDWGGIRTYFMDNVWPVLKVVFRELKDWLEVNLPKAVLFLRDVWENILVPALETLKVFWETTLKPALINLVDWLMKYIPLAVDVLKVVWETILLPAIQKLTDFWESTLEPALSDLFAYLDEHLPVAIDILTPLIQGVLVGAFNSLTGAAGWLWNILTQLGTLIGGMLSWALGNAGTLVSALERGLWGIRNAAFWVVDQINKMAGSLSSIGNSVPDFLIPGSPTPFEMGIRGITAAISDFDHAMANFQNDAMTQAMQGAGAGSRSSQTTNNFNLNISSNASRERVVSDFDMMKSWAGR